MPYLEAAGFQLSKNIKFVNIGWELTEIWGNYLQQVNNVANYNVTIYNEQSGGYLCVCVWKRGMLHVECHFDFLKHLSSDLLAGYTVRFRNVTSFMLDFMKFFFKMADA